MLEQTLRFLNNGANPYWILSFVTRNRDYISINYLLEELSLDKTFAIDIATKYNCDDVINFLSSYNLRQKQ